MSLWPTPAQQVHSLRKTIAGRQLVAKAAEAGVRRLEAEASTGQNDNSR